MGRTCSMCRTIQKCIQSFSGRPEENRPLGRPRRRWEDNIKVDLKAVGCDSRIWMDFTQIGTNYGLMYER